MALNNRADIRYAIAHWCAHVLLAFSRIHFRPPKPNEQAKTTARPLLRVRLRGFVPHRFVRGRGRECKSGPVLTTELFERLALGLGDRPGRNTTKQHKHCVDLSTWSIQGVSLLPGGAPPDRSVETAPWPIMEPTWPEAAQIPWSADL